MSWLSDLFRRPSHQPTNQGTTPMSSALADAQAAMARLAAAGDALIALNAKLTAEASLPNDDTAGLPALTDGINALAAKLEAAVPALVADVPAAAEPVADAPAA